MRSRATRRSWRCTRGIGERAEAARPRGQGLCLVERGGRGDPAAAGPCLGRGPAGLLPHGTHKYDWAFVIAPDDATFFAALEGEPVKDDISTALGNETWRLLVAAGRATPADEPEAVHAFLPMRDGQLGIASVTAITAEKLLDRRAPGRGAVRPGGGPQPDRGLVGGAGRRAAPDGGGDRRGADGAGARARARGPRGRTVQAVKDPDGRTGLLLAGPDGTTMVGQAAWRPNRPGTQYLMALLPSLGIALLLFVAFGWSALRQSRSLTSAIVESEGRFRDVADASSDWIFETDAEGRLTWISGSVHRADRHPGRRDRGPADHRPAAADGRRGPVGRARRGAAASSGCSAASPAATSTGGPAARPCGCPASRPATPPARHVGWRGTATDVTVEIEARKTAEFLSGHDALTGCLNRQGLIEGPRRGAGASAAPQPAGGLPDARPRPVQGGQRRPRADRRRSADPGRGAERLADAGSAGRRRRPAGCGRVRAGPSGGGRCAGGPRLWPSRCRTSWRSR